MSSTASSVRGFWLTGEPSTSTATEPKGEIVYKEFGARPIPLANTVSFESLLGELERDPDMAGRLGNARRNLAKQLHGDRSDTLAAARLAKGMSQSQLAQGAGTTQSYIARIERGQADPSTEMVTRIAGALGIDDMEAFRAIRNQRAIRE